MARPTKIVVLYCGRLLSLRQLAKSTGHKYATISYRYWRQKLRGPELWAPSKRPRTHVA